MWIMLLDHSDSMGCPFEAHDFSFSARVRAFETTIKLEAAKKVVLFLQQLDESTTVILAGFAETVHLIAKRPAGDSEQFARKPQGLEPTDGTDITAALNYAVECATAHRDETPKPQVVLISDGQSRLDEAKLAAHRCADGGTRVDMLLIDPTEEGRALAKAVTRITGG